MAKPKTRRSWRLLLLLPLPVLWCVLGHFGALDFLENRLTDLRFRARSEIDAPVKVVYIDIDSQSIAEIGGWPWSRSYLAKVAATLVAQAGVKAIGVDLVLSENGISESADLKKMVEGNIELARYLSKGAPVVLAGSYSAELFRDVNGTLTTRQLPRLGRGPIDPEKVEPPELPSFNVGRQIPWTPPYVGLIDTIDEGTRWVPAFVPSSIRTYRHMAIELALLHWGLTAAAVQVHDDRIDLVRPDGTRVTTIPLQDRQLIELNWFSHWISPKNPRMGFSTVFNYARLLDSDKPEEKKTAQAFFAQDAFKDAIVLIGPVDPLLQDLASTSFDNEPVPKVGVHGNLLKTIVSGKYLWRLPPWAGDGLAVLLTLLVSTLAVAGGARGVRNKLFALVVVAGYVALAFGLFASSQLVLPLAVPLAAVFTTSLGAVGWQLGVEEKQKGRIKGMFGTYVSPQLVDRMVESGDAPQLGGHDDEITAYFSDIQSFSTFSEKLGSGPLVELMNEYLTACTDIVQGEGGTLDKYIGDAVVAMFGAPLPLPDHAFRACVASQLVHRKLGELRAKWKAEGGKWPEIVWNMQTRIGLNSGQCMIGNMGSRTRFNYTMMGDNVNLAARMESGAKAWGAYSMCAEATKLACEKHGGDRVVFRPLSRLQVKGRQQGTPVFEIVGLKEDVTPRTRECLGLFEQGLARYYARDWQGAIALFRRSAELEPNIPGQTPGVVSNPSLVYLDRVIPEAMADPPPENWDGVYHMKEK